MRPAERARRVAATIGIVIATAVASLAGGLATTALWPTPVTTSYYAADIKLTARPSAASSIGASTIVGDLAARFSGPAPGVVVEPRVRPEIADAVAGGPIRTSDLVVSEEERSRVVTDATKGVALRFVLGAGIGAGLVAGVYLLPGRGRMPRRRALAIGGGALLTCALVGLSAQQTYRPERFVALESTGLLKIAADNKDLLTEVETRADQATPYLRNLLALSAALGSEYAPDELAQTPAVTVLLVSDIHSANQYALMRTIVQERDVDVVIDTGDLINLGHVEEARLTGLYRGIESLEVPYVFVRGNHDASSSTNTKLLDDLAALDNVTLLEPGDGSYQEVDAGGIRIAGFNDPRWYCDADDGSTDDQRAARDDWLEGLGDATPPDITLSHEAPALEDAPGRVRIHGHGHVPLRDGNRLQVGTFTGGGTLSHFRPSGPDAELVGQPSAFDLLTFGADCQAQTLTRYEYRSIIEGRPSYDRLSVMNAGRVVDPAEPDRACGDSPFAVRPLGEGQEPSGD